MRGPPSVQWPRPLEPDVLELEGLALDAGRGRGDPVGDLAGLGDGLHDALQVLAVAGAREPFGAARLELFGRDDAAFGVEVVAGVLADVAVEARRGQGQALGDARLFEVAVPAVERARAV